jgi:hypothetical protein
LTRVVLAVTAVGLVLSGCGPASTAKPTPAVLVPSVGDGYHLANASGPLSAESLAVATAVPHAAMTAYLSGASLRSAGERVWTSNADGFVTDIVARFASAQDAQGLVALAGKTLPGPASQPFSPPGTPGGRGFVQTSDVAGKTMFCVIGFAPSGVQVFMVTRCTPYPQDTVTLSHLLAQQLARAA